MIISIIHHIHLYQSYTPGVNLANIQTGISGVRVLLDDRKNYFAADRKAKKILSEKQNPKYPRKA